MSTLRAAESSLDSADINATTRRRIPADVWLAAALLLMFGAMHNGYWSRGGDSDVYLAMARSIATGRGYCFNNQPVSLVTPLWPFLLAGAMKISASFGFLKLLPMLFMTAGMLIWYRVLLMVVSPKAAFWSVLLGAMLQPVSTLTWQFHTEGVFTLISAAQVWVALQINREMRAGWRIAVLMILCAASVSTRWAGALWFVMLAGALMHGRALLPLSAVRRNIVPWLACAASLLVTLAVFLVLRHALKVPLDRVDPRYDDTLTVHYSLFNNEPTAAIYVHRMAVSGQWIGTLLWQPLTEYGKHLRNATSACGTLLLLVAVVYLPALIRRREWLFAAVLVYLGWLCIDWPAPVARYLVPAAPLLLALFGSAGAELSRTSGRAGKWLVAPAMKLVIASLLLLNGTVVVVESAVAHRGNFYAAYEAGLDQSLIDAAACLQAHGAGDGQIAMNRVDANLGRARDSNSWMRAMVVLSDVGVRTVPDDLTGVTRPDMTVAQTFDPLGAPILQWLQQEKVRYYLYRPESAIFWHFDVRGLPLKGFPPKGAGDAMDWRVYEVDEGGFHQVIPPRTHDWPRKMPGM